MLSMKRFSTINPLGILFFCLSLFFLSTNPLQAEENALRISMFPANIQYNPLRTYTSVEAQIYTAIYEGLVVPDPLTLRPIPGVASRWEANEDATEYRFYLRSNARYSDGQQITAEDAVNTFIAHLNPEQPSSFSGFLDIVKGARDYRNGRGAKEDVGIHSGDHNSIVFELTHPAPYFLDLLTHQSMVLIHPDMLASGDWDSLESILGNGPFILESADETGLKLIKNEYYWDKNRVSPEQILIEFNADVAAVTEQFNKGEIFWAKGNFAYGSVISTDYVKVTPVFSTNFFFFNNRQEAFQDPNIRRGLALLIPWQEIRHEDAYFSPSNQLIPEIPMYPAVKGILEQDIAEGLRLLAEAGHPMGRNLPPITFRVPEGTENAALAIAFSQALITAAPELNVSIEELTDQEDYYSRLREDDYTIGSITWIGDYLDPLTFLMLFISDSGINESAYINPEFDALIEASHRQNGKERYETLGRAESLLLTEGTAWPIHHTVAFHLVNTREIDGWFPTGLDLHPFKYIRKIDFLPGPGVTMKNPNEFDQTVSYEYTRRHEIIPKR